MKHYTTAAMIALYGIFATTLALAEAGDGTKSDHQPGVNSQSSEKGHFNNVGPMPISGAIPSFMLEKIVSDPKLAEELGLKDEQIKALKESFEESKKSSGDLRTQMMEAEQARRKLVEARSTDEAALIAATEKVARIRLEMEKSYVKQLVLANKTFTPDQTEKIREKMKDLMRQHMRNAGKKPDVESVP